mmetsp:Transcript_2552/g.6655  ORF Transcript_2552/g.6655 Transcript_2552/m.6655 type:complete len:137 (+) Transcript_2552:833-1243(+)
MPLSFIWVYGKAQHSVWVYVTVVLWRAVFSVTRAGNREMTIGGIDTNCTALPRPPGRDTVLWLRRRRRQRQQRRRRKRRRRVHVQKGEEEYILTVSISQTELEKLHLSLFMLTQRRSPFFVRMPFRHNDKECVTEI